MPGEWIPSVVDSTSEKTTTHRRVLVAIGANYATGAGSLPSKATACHRRTPQFVEAKLGGQRHRARSHIAHCVGGQTKSHWNGLLPFNPDKSLATLDIQVREITANNFHFVMTNLSPWITSRDWATIRDNGIESSFEILAQPGITGGMLEYFKALKKIVGSGAIWIGHGNAEVYGVFLHYCRRLHVDLWFFDSNLSQRSRFV